MRLIDADKLYKEVEDGMSGNKQGFESLKNIFLGAFCQLINEQPTVDAEPVKHGEWIYSQKLCSAKCSICSAVAITCSQYCPYCGAKMEEGEENA